MVELSQGTSVLAVILPRKSRQECYRCHRSKYVTAVTASRMLPQSPLQECNGSRRSHHHPSKSVTVIDVTRMLWRTPIQECYGSHHFRHVTAVTAARGLPHSPLRECARNHSLRERYCCHRFTNVTAVTASGMIPQPPFQECDRSHRFKNVTAIAVAKTRLPWSCIKNVTSGTAAKMDVTSHGFKQGNRSLRFKSVAVTS